MTNQIKTQNLLEELNSIHISQLQGLENQVSFLESAKPPNQCPPSSSKLSLDDQNPEAFLSLINHIDFQKWYVSVNVIVKDVKFYSIAMLDSDADMNYIQEGLIPSKYFEKTKEKMTSATGSKLQINYKLSNAYICNNEYCFKSVFILVKNLKQQVILGTPFLTQIYPFTLDSKGIYSNVLGKEIKFEFSSPMKNKNIAALQQASISKITSAKEKQIAFLQTEIIQASIEEQLVAPKIKQKIQTIKKLFEEYVCTDIANAF